MIRVLHVLESGADFQTQRCVEHLSRDLGSGYEVGVRRVGAGGDWGTWAGAVRGLKGEGSEVVHAWGLKALTLAALGARGRLIYSPTSAPDRRGLGWLRAVMAYRPVQVICPTAALRRAVVGGGVGLEHCHVIRPGVEFARVRAKRDAGLRAALGFGSEDYVLLGAGESTRAAAHRDAVWAAGIMHVLDARCKLLLWGRGSDVPGVMEFHRRLQNPGLLYLAEQRLGRKVEFEELLGVADVVLVTAGGTVPVLPICLAMAGGVPIVSTVTYTTSELLEDHHTALMVARHSPRAMAQRILELREDGRLRWQLADMARTEAFSYFALTRFLEQYRAVYGQWAQGQRVEVPEPPAGAGLRFHGRV